MAKHTVAGVKIPQPTKLKGGGKSPITPTHGEFNAGPSPGSIKRSDQEGKRK